MNVYGDNYAAVAWAVNEEKGYVGSKADLVNEVTPHVLDWWQRPTVNTPMAIAMSKSDQYRYCKHYVKRRVQPVGFFQTLFWPFILKAVIQLVLEWLNSRESQEWRMANQ
jgi:hypothetical protein